ncbi:MAG: helix-turn-helix transcriptional regulator [Polaromonas sp.]|nr:helix-turn-helix transcriptional regulator [Polaromonas sp.]
MTSFLRQRRSLLQMSQAQLAEQLAVSQQTVARWETSGQIPAKHIKDLAILLGARAQDFLPRAEEGPAMKGAKVVLLRAPEANPQHENAQVPFGDVQLHFAGHADDEPMCFPVTWGTLNRIQDQLGDAGMGIEQLASWVHFETLNNKSVLVNTKHVDRISFVNDDVEEMSQVLHDEVYKAATDLWRRLPSAEDMETDDFPYSKALVEKVAKAIADAGEHPWIEFDGFTVEFTSGQRLSKPMNPEVASSLAFLEGEAAQRSFNPQGFLQLTLRDDGRFEHVRLDGVRLIEASLAAYVKACDQGSEDI